MSDTITSPVDDLVGPALRGYLECAAWLAPGEDGEEYDGDYSLATPTPEATQAARETVEDFVLANAEDCLAYVRARLRDLSYGESPDARALEAGADHLGHDLFLTQNGHGAGFWDRGLGDLGDRLTAAAKPYGEATFVITNSGNLDVL